MIAPTFFHDIYLLAASHYLPGEPINNQQIDAYVAPIDQNSKRIKQRVLGENGIQTRHYAINTAGKTQISHTEMACRAIQSCLQQAQVNLSEVDLLASASSGGDVLMPGVANMIQGALHAPPMETHSHQGVCASSVMALKDAAQSLAQNPEQDLAVVVAAEMPSRIFKQSRFTSQTQIDFEAHFLRWMLSDGAGAVLLGNGSQALKQTVTNTLAQQGLALKLNWIHSKSFSGDYPVCMQFGQGSHRSKEQHSDYSAEASYLDFPSVAEAEAAGHFALRQNLRLLPNLFEVAVHEYAGLVQGGWVKPAEVDTFFCHYSSEALGKTCESMMDAAGLGIPREKWFSNLKTCGNTGAASIFIMLSEWLATHTPKAGQKIFAFVPESGRFTVSYFMLEVLELATINQSSQRISSISPPAKQVYLPQPPAWIQQDMRQPVRDTLLELGEIWHQFRSQIWRTPLVEKINAGQLTPTDYVTWMAQWIPQVREGSLWMREAVAHLDEPYQVLASLITEHANDEQYDFKILFEDYQAAGGQAASIDELQRNAGGEALNSYLYRQAKQANPFGLLGGIYIIEGTGQRIVPWLLPLIKQQLKLPERCYRFLKYHGENDEQHLARWLMALEFALEVGGETTQREIVRTARDVATLYQLQMEHIL
ncbi:3-oxoacyl-[acyl-carrier-protein] synthase III C-terminal domain-containing protein [uncultured Thiothrix sp.]|uniref:3-oxoacyl-[acyl-carrier-protein] synthase III C-terminal domain-containing protein n=1 Tax=uncultured Thiothrix sp. TaxID=223185 RepID=UPI0026133B83|nr:3-oxoacyl-[acyl-carrier-protein] synthase III C-terminal domain-containing protein [uncultured Thiothrix sp.]